MVWGSAWAKTAWASLQGRWDAGDPLEAGLGQLLQILGAIEGTVGHQIGGAVGGVELRNVVTDDLAERFAITDYCHSGAASAPGYRLGAPPPTPTSLG